MKSDYLGLRVQQWHSRNQTAPGGLGDAITRTVMAQRTTIMNEVDLDSFILIMMEDKMKRRVSEVDLDSFILIMMEDKKMNRRVRRSQGGS